MVDDPDRHKSSALGRAANDNGPDSAIDKLGNSSESIPDLPVLHSGSSVKISTDIPAALPVLPAEIALVVQFLPELVPDIIANDDSDEG